MRPFMGNFLHNTWHSCWDSFFSYFLLNEIMGEKSKTKVLSLYLDILSQPEASSYICSQTNVSYSSY